MKDLGIIYNPMYGKSPINKGKPMSEDQRKKLKEIWIKKKIIKDNESEIYK
jgi:hypothetical protein